MFFFLSNSFRLYPWGNSENPKKEHWMNIWHGEFPKENTADDGYDSTCPVSVSVPIYIYKSYTDL